MSGSTSDLFRISPDQLRELLTGQGEDEDEVLSKLALFHCMRFSENDDKNELDAAQENAELGLQKMRQGHPKHAERLHNLGKILGDQYRQTSQMKTLEKAIRVRQLAVKLNSDEDPNQISRLISLSECLVTRYEATHDMRDLDEAIRVAELAESVARDGHPNQFMALNGLATKLGHRYRRTGQVQDLEKAISLGKRSVDLVPDNHPTQAACLCNLGNSYEDRYIRTQQMEDLDEAIRVTELALKLTPGVKASLLPCLNGLGTKLVLRYNLTGQRRDLDVAIATSEHAAKLTPTGHKSRARTLCGLGTKLITRGKLTGDVNDLDEAIRFGELAVKATPAGSTDSAIYLNNLANFIESRYEMTKQNTDLEEALRILRLSQDLSPSDFPDLTSKQSKLRERLERWHKEQLSEIQMRSQDERSEAEILLAKLEKQGVPVEWDESISMERMTITDQIPLDERNTLLKALGNHATSIEINNFEYAGTFETKDRRRDLEGLTGPANIPLGLKTTFKYPQLPKGHVRFLRGILPSSHPLARLESHLLETAPSYTAISYAWGMNETTRTVFLNNTSFAISVHVLEALNQFSALVPGSHLIWLDRICINQEDEVEKAYQVGRMRDIYTQAQEVVIWIGATAHSSDILIDSMPTMLDELKTLPLGSILPNSSLSLELWHALGHFYTRDWFRRLWVVQEALLAKNIIVLCGSRQVPWETFANLTAMLLEARLLPDIIPRGLELKDVEPGFYAMIAMKNLRMTRLALNGLPLYPFLKLLDHARVRQVGQPVDRIWAVIGLAPPAIYVAAAPLINYSYSATTKYWETYINFVKILLTKDAGLHILALCYSEATLDELPSWCPNFNSPPAFASRIQDAWRSFHAGQSANTKKLEKVTFDPNSHAMLVNGFRVDRVDMVIENTAYTQDNTWFNHDFRMAMEFQRKITGIQDWERKCRELACSVYGTGKNVPDAHWRTLILDHIKFPHKRCSSSDRKCYDIFTGWLLGRETLDDEQSRAYALSVAAGTSGRPYISTKKGRVGIAPPGTKQGDLICIFYGAPVPYFLRFDESGVARLIGDGFVNGMMYGEALQIDDRGDDEMICVL